MPPRLIEEYQVGWVCALSKEMAAARAMLDEEHEPMSYQDPQDHNNYVLGRVHNHNVVIACLPAGVDGNNAAAIVAANMRRTFKWLRFGLMVGIGGGIPNLEKGVDIRLGDVVVSQPDKTHGGVVQYDKGKSLAGGNFELKGSLNRPPPFVLTALSALQSKHDVHGSQISTYLTQMIGQHPLMEENGYIFPGTEQDCLYCANCKPTSSDSCDQCQDGQVLRKKRLNTKAVVHYGIIASGNQVVKDPVVRDRLSQQFGAKCVEMEAAGLMDNFPCLVIRGVCDYADAHKNDVWHKYAAITAAGYAKEFLSIIPPKDESRVSSAADMTKYNRGLNLFDAPDLDDGLFIGRDTELEQMKNILLSNSKSSTRKVLVLGGMGGIGKTQLTITYAKKYRSSYTSIFWLNASSRTALLASLRRLAREILPDARRQLADDVILTQVSIWLSNLENPRWLLAFDNYDNPDQFDIREYFPSVAQGSIIITTRQPDRVNGRKIKIRSMTEKEESLRILATRSGRKNVESDPDAQLLAERLDGHPLALATAGAFLSQSAVSFTRYLQQYEAKWKVVDSVQELSDYPSRTLYSTWDLSFAQIQQQNARAANLLRFLAYLDHQDIWYDLLHSGQGGDQPVWFAELASDEFVFEDAMQTLTRYCLVESHQHTGTYRLHVCVHDWTMDGLNRHVNGTQYWLAVDCVAGHVKDVEWVDLSALKYRRINLHAERLLHDRFRATFNLHTFSQRRNEKITKIADLLAQQVQYKAAERIYLRALAGYETALGPDHTSTLTIVHSLGNLYTDQGKLAAAEQMYQRALAGEETALGPDHTSTLTTVYCLGNLYMDQGKLAAAEQMYQRALAGEETALGPDHTSTLDTVHSLGNLYMDQGKLAAAEQMYQRALAGDETALGPDHTSTLTTVHCLGNLYRHQGKLAAAEQMYQRALAGEETALGPDHTSTLTTVHCLGNLYMDQGKLAAAEQMYQRALAGDETALGPDHTSTLTTVHCLGNLYMDQGKLAAAEQMYQRALAGRETALGPEHTSTLTTVHCLGNLYRDQGKLAAAEQMYQRALAGDETALGPDHTSTLTTVHCLGNLYMDQGKLAAAEQMYQRALAGRETALGPEHTSTLTTVHCLGNLYRDQGKLAAAEQMYQRALAGYETALGPDHTLTLGTVHCLGNLYMDQGKLAAAEQMYQRALAGRETALGPDHTSTLLTIVSFGSLFCQQGRQDEAGQMYQRALTGFQNALGRQHTSTLGTMNNLENLYCEKHELDRAEQMYRQALAGMEQALGSEHMYVFGIINNLGVLYADRGLLVESKQMYQRALDGLQPYLGSDHPLTGMVINNLHRLQEEAGKDQATNFSEGTAPPPRRRWYFS